MEMDEKDWNMQLDDAQVMKLPTEYGKSLLNLCDAKEQGHL